MKLPLSTFSPITCQRKPEPSTVTTNIDDDAANRKDAFLKNTADVLSAKVHFAEISKSTLKRTQSDP